MRCFRLRVSHHSCPGDGSLIRGAALALLILALGGWFSTGKALALQPGHGSGETQAGTLQRSGLTFEYSRSSVNFENVVVGGVATHQVTITNNGSSPLTLSTYQVSGNAFSVVGLTLPVTLESAQSLSFTARFAPTVTGTFIGSVIVDGAGSQRYTTSLRGTGDASTFILTLSPASLNFGNVMVGGDAQLPILVQNRGTGNVTVSSASVTGTGYTLSNLKLPVSLNAGQSMSFTVTFAPTGLGASSGAVRLTSDTGNSPNTVSLTGTGLTRTKHAVKLTWTDSTSPGVIQYDIYRGTVSGGPYSEVATVSGSSTSYIDRSVAVGQTYYYVATAVTGTGQSGYSNEAMATIP